MHSNDRNTTTLSGFFSLVGKVEKHWHSIFVKGWWGLERSQRLLVVHIYIYTFAGACMCGMQVRCLPGMSRSESLSTLVSIPDERGGRCQTRLKKNTREVSPTRRGGRVVAKKHSRKDIASYASDARNIRTEPGRDRRGFLEGKGGCAARERKNTLARKKVIRRCSASQGVVWRGMGEGGKGCSLVASVNLDSRKWNLPWRVS